MNKEHHRLNGAIVGGAIALLLNPVHLPAGIVLGIFGGVLPDLDAKRTGLYSRLNKRKSLHNIAIWSGLLLVGMVSNFVLYIAIGAISHVLLDMCCSRRGVALFYPLSTTEIGTNGGVTVDDERAGIVTISMSAFQILLFGYFLTGAL